MADAKEIDGEEEEEVVEFEEGCPECKKCPPVGAPAWMATFADMATLLMAFFVLLLSFAETEVPKFKQVAGSLKMAFGIEKIVPKVTIPMARSIMVENFTPAVAERSVMDVKEQQSDFVRGDFIEKKTEEGEYEDPLDSDFQQVQEALPEPLKSAVVRQVDDEGHIGLAYSKIVAVITGALQEQQAMIEEAKREAGEAKESKGELEARVAELEKEVEAGKKEGEARARRILELEREGEARTKRMRELELAVERLVAASDLANSD